MSERIGGPNPGEEGYHECENCDYLSEPHQCPVCGKEHMTPQYILDEREAERVETTELPWA